MQAIKIITMNQHLLPLERKLKTKKTSTGQSIKQITTVMKAGIGLSTIQMGRDTMNFTALEKN